MRRSGGLACSIAVLVIAPRSAPAQALADRLGTASAPEVQDVELLPFGLGPPSPLRLAKVRGGYDGAASAADMEVEVSAPLAQFFALRAGAAYDGLGQGARPQVSGLFSLLRDGRTGTSLGALGGFEARGFNTVPNAMLGVTAAQELGRILLVSSLTYGRALTSPESYGRASVAALARVSQMVRLGVDSRGELDLERDADEPAEEPDWRVRGGPFVSASLGTFAVSVGGGVAALRYRFGPPAAVSGTAYAALSAAF